MINRQDSRHRIKRSNLTGVVPTAHTASTDFTDGTWLNTDLREAEFFYNIPDKKLWIGTGTSSIEIAQIGSTTSGNSLEQTLAIGNNSGAQSIIMGTGTNIHTSQGTGGLSLDITGPQSVYLGDNMTATANYLWLRDGNFLRLRANNNHIELAAQSTTIGIGDTYDGIVLSPNTGLSTHIHYGGSEILSVTGSGIIMGSFSNIHSSFGESYIDVNFNNQGSILLSNATDGGDPLNNASAYIIVASNIGTYTSDGILIGSDTGNIKIQTSSALNLVTTNGINLQSDTYIYSGYALKSNNGGGRIDLDGYGTPNTILITTDNAAEAESVIYLDDSSISLTTNANAESISIGGGKITETATTIKLVAGYPSMLPIPSTPGSLYLSAGTGSVYMASDVVMASNKSIKFDYTTLTTGSVSTTTIGTFSMATITMNNDTSVSIKGHANGYCGSPNRNMGATFYASFLKYGGTIYQNGTTDIVLKDGYGDGTTPAVWTDGTNIYISVRTFSALTSTFTTSYEILV